jgi:uncharacterized membrane protein YdcZ (DUF606 family)
MKLWPSPLSPVSNVATTHQLSSHNKDPLFSGSLSFTQGIIKLAFVSIYIIGLCYE